MMSKIDTAKTENDRTARVLRDDELDAVSGGKVLGGRAKIVDGRYQVAPGLVTVPTTHG
jgi:hypothetical protein